MELFAPGRELYGDESANLTLFCSRGHPSRGVVRLTNRTRAERTDGCLDVPVGRCREEIPCRCTRLIRTRIERKFVEAFGWRGSRVAVDTVYATNGCTVLREL